MSTSNLNPSIETSSNETFRDVISRDTEYRDIDLRFIPHPMTGNINPVREINAVKSALKNLILTEPGERPFQPRFGTPLNGFLFNLNDLNPFDIEEQIERTIAKYEPRVKVKDIRIERFPDQHAINVSIYFDIINLEIPYTVELTLKRTR